MTANIMLWLVFSLVVVGMLFIDLKFVHKQAHAVSAKEAALWSVFWIVLALLFGLGIHFTLGKEKALQYLTGYVIEKSLSVDNLFVFLMIFSYFAVPPKFQPRVLHWGIMGALIMRLVIILVGATLVHKFAWILYFFGALLIYTGISMAFEKEKKLEPEKNPVLRIFRKCFPVTTGAIDDENFFERINGRVNATSLFVVLILVESSDLIFAVDSIPAIFAVTTDPFIVYTSNVFAILGLRALYFLLSSIMPMFRFLKYGLSIILTYVGVKMLIVDFYKIPTAVSLSVVLGILALSVIVSMLVKKAPTPGAA